MRTALTVVLLMGAASVRGLAQEVPPCFVHSDLSADSVVRHFAPVLHFAPGERFFPTTPFLTAYFRLGDNEISPVWDAEGHPSFNPGTSSPLFLNRLDSLYQLADQLDADGVRYYGPPSPVVFYRVRSLTSDQTRRIWRNLKDDPYSWRRFWNVSSLPRDIEREPLMVIEYYFYYTGDRGLVGHPEDIETVFVFIPQDLTRICDFRIVVGAGHKDRTPNNILLMNEMLAPVNNRVHVLVELGGHSSAPDLAPYGRYQLGTDVNWNLHHAWGTRDVQAISGRGWLGPYQSEMTVSRDTISAVILNPDTPFTSRPGPDGVNQFRYRLIPVSSLEHLSEAVNAFEASRCFSGTAGTECESLRAVMYEAYDRYAEELGTRSQRRPGERYEQLELQLLAWIRRMDWLDWEARRRTWQPKHAIWRHALYTGSPAMIFKDHLVSPSNVGTRYISTRWLTWGATVWPHEAGQVQIGLLVPNAISEVALPGSSQFQVGLVSADWFDGLDRRGISLAWLVETSYEDYTGVYGKLAYVSNARHVTDETTGASWSLSGGASLLPFIFTNAKVFGLVNALRIRLGGRINLNGPSRFSRIDAELQVELRQ